MTPDGAMASGKTEAAETAALAALAAGDESRGVLRLAASAHHRGGRFDAAAQLYGRALRLAPADASAWIGLCNCALAARRPEDAIRAADAGLARLPDEPGLLVAKARVLQSLSRLAEAEALYRRALAQRSDHPEARRGLAWLALEAGDLDSAEAWITGALGSPEADSLAARIAFERGDAETALLRAGSVLQAESLAPPERAEAELLAGEALDRLGRPAEAFAAFARGKGLLHAYYAERAAGREAEADKLNRLAAWFASADPPPWREAAPPTPSMTGGAAGHAFLVGFPRSGTTLLEQALAGHPDLVALEEAPTLADAYDALMTSPAALERLARLSPAEAETWRAAYWAEVARGGVDPRGKLFLDKAPAGTLYLPLIAKLFPAAKVLFALRDPRDVVLSCFRNSFQMNALTYAFTDLGETARCYAACMAMADVYRRVLPLPVLDVRLETLVDDFEGELARITGFLGLDLSPAMLDVAATAARRTVRTPSAPQVRAGLNRAGLGRWRAFERELGPVLPMLAPWVERFGYGADG